VTVSRALRQK